MAGRVRSEVLSQSYADYRMETVTSFPSGTCTTDPGPKTKQLTGPPLAYSGTLLEDYETRTMTDVVTPGFHKMKAQGKIINNPMSSVYEKVHIPVLSVYMDSTYNQEKACNPTRFVHLSDMTTTGTVDMTRVCGSNLWLNIPNGDDVTSLKDQAILKAWANIDRAEILATASFVEMNQTLSGLMYLFKKVHRILTAVKTKNAAFLRMKKNSKNEFSAKELAEVYLNARYNLRPLYYDIKGIMSVWNKTLTKAQRQTFRSSMSMTATDSDVVVYDWWGLPNWKWPVNIHRAANKKVTVRAGVLTDCGPLSLHELIGGESLVETVWDLIPFSFIIDWFANVGDYISAWTPEMKIKPLASWIVTTIVTTQTSTVLGSGAYYTNNGDISEQAYVNASSVSPSTAERIVISKVREPEYSRPTLPTFRFKLDPLKLLDLGLILRNISGFRYKL